MAENLVSGKDAPPDLPPPEYVIELVQWLTAHYGEIEACCTSKGLPKPPRW